MYEFPPQTWYMTGWWPMVCHIAVLMIGSGCMVTVALKRKQYLFDQGVILGVATVMTVLIACFPIGELWEAPKTASGAHFLLTWTAALIASIYHMRKMFHDDPWRGKLRLPVTLLEAFVGLMVFGLLAALVFPAVSQPRWSPHRACFRNLRQIGIALHNYHDAFDSLPMSRSGDPPHSWRVALLPYLDQYGLSRQYQFELAWNEGTNRRVALTKLLAYECPFDSRLAPSGKFPRSDYLAVVGDHTLWQPAEPTRFEEVSNADGLSNTLMVVEACGTDIPWAEPRDLSFNDTPLGINLPGSAPHRSDGMLSSYHRGGAEVLFADGSVWYLPAQTSPEILRALLTKNGNEDVDRHSF